MRKLTKTLVTFAIVVLALSMLLGISSIAQTNDEQQPSLENMLIGTWRWESTRSWIFVFRPDGTGVCGMPGMRTSFTWHVIGNDLFIDNANTNISISGNSITVNRFGRTTRYTYIRYSDSYNVSASLWLPIVLIVGIGAIITTVVVLSRKRKRRRNEEMAKYWAARANQSEQPPMPPPGQF